MGIENESPSEVHHRERCEKHDKVLYRNRKDAVGATMGHLKSQRLRVYPCDDHPGLVHLTKETIKYRSERDYNRKKV